MKANSGRENVGHEMDTAHGRRMEQNYKLMEIERGETGEIRE